MRHLATCILTIWSFAVKAQFVDHYKIDFFGTSSSVFPCLYIINEKSSEYKSDLAKNSKGYQKIIKENYLISLSSRDFTNLSMKLDSLTSFYFKPISDSIYNVFIVSKKTTTAEAIKCCLSKFNENLQIFYVSLYKFVNNNRYPEKLIRAIRYHITFIEEQVIGKKIKLD